MSIDGLFNPNSYTLCCLNLKSSKTITTNNLETKNINGIPYVACNCEPQLKNLVVDVVLKNKMLEQLLLTVEQQGIQIEELKKQIDILKHEC